MLATASIDTRACCAPLRYSSMFAQLSRLALPILYRAICCPRVFVSPSSNTLAGTGLSTLGAQFQMSSNLKSAYNAFFAIIASTIAFDLCAQTIDVST